MSMLLVRFCYKFWFFGTAFYWISWTLLLVRSFLCVAKLVELTSHNINLRLSCSSVDTCRKCAHVSWAWCNARINRCQQDSVAWFVVAGVPDWLRRVSLPTTSFAPGACGWTGRIQWRQWRWAHSTVNHGDQLIQPWVISGVTGLMLMTDVSQGPWKLVKAPPHDDKQTVSRAICIPVCIVRHFVCVQCVCARVCLSLSMTFGTLQLLVKMLFSGVTQRTSLKLRKYRISLYYLCGQILFCRKSCVRHFHETALSIIIFWRTVRTLIYREVKLVITRHFIEEND